MCDNRFLYIDTKNKMVNRQTDKRKVETDEIISSYHTHGYKIYTGTGNVLYAIHTVKY